MDGAQQIVIDGVEGEREGAVNDTAVDLRAKVNLAHVVVLEHRLVAGVRCVVSRNVVQRATRREANSYWLWKKNETFVWSVL